MDKKGRTQLQPVCALLVDDSEEDALRLIGALPMLLRALQRLIVRSVKFIRWLRGATLPGPHHAPALAALRQLYATL